MHDPGLVAAGLGGRKGPGPPRDGFVEPLVVHVDGGQNRVRLRQFPARRAPFYRLVAAAAIAGWAAAVVAGGVLGGAAPVRYDPPQETIDPATQRVEVRLVRVPVPTRDWAAETVQMSVAAALGAIVAARATAARQRRRKPPPPGPGLIDITDVVRSGTGEPPAAGFR
ncbi:hypothetical protein [Actinoplanes subtropicus]|uniref:hypothetical protein n=1 Tax=Actinoplanes subtropicus TaxID=543632 RepID=UPI000A84C406|nr:hypothetical protein [Actinoplanes subtropicus]